MGGDMVFSKTILVKKTGQKKSNVTPIFRALTKFAAEFFIEKF